MEGVTQVTVFAAGEDHKLATYYSDDTATEVDADAFTAAVAIRIGEEAEAGWRPVSTSVFPSRQIGSAGNVLFQTGGAVSTLLVAVVRYERVWPR